MSRALESFSATRAVGESAKVGKTKLEGATANDIDECLDLADKATEALEHAVEMMQKLAKRLRKVDSRMSGNLEQYALGNCEAWLEDESKGGGNTLPEIQAELEKMMEEAENEDEKE